MPENQIALSPNIERPDHPLAVIRNTLMTQSPFPSGYAIETEAVSTSPGQRLPCIRHCISPDETRLVVAGFTTINKEKDRPARMDVWNLKTLKLEREIYLPGLSGLLLMNRNGVVFSCMFEDIAFVGNDHLALGLANGFLKIIRISDGEIVNAARIGGNVGSLTCSKGRLAVSIFPGPNGTDIEAVGVKLFHAASLLNGEPFDAAEIINLSVLGMVLPHEIRFVDHGARLLCKGGVIRSNGFTNTVWLLDLRDRTSGLLFVEDDKEISHTISADPYSKTCCITGRDSYKLLGLDHQFITGGLLPEHLKGDHNKGCSISPDGKKWIITRNGVAYLFQTGREPLLFPLEMGWISFSYFISNGEMVCRILRGSSYELCVFNIELWPPRLVRSSWRKTDGFESVSANAFDVAGDGSFFMADREGRIRVFQKDFTLIKTHPLFRGSIKSIKRDPHMNRVGLLSDSGAIFKLLPTCGQPEIHTNCLTNKKMDAGSGVKYIQFKRNPSDQEVKTDCLFWMSDDADDVSIYIAGNRHVQLSSRITTCHIRDCTSTDKEPFAAFSLYSCPVGGDDLRGRAVILLENGTLLVFDPNAITNGTDSLEKVPGLKRFPDALPPPCGVCRISDDRVAAWSETRLWVIDILDDFSPSVQSTKDITGIVNVKYDPVSERLMIAFASHIEFRSIALEVIFRLYLSTAGGVLIHVPYPEALCHGIRVEHPGYFWPQGKVDTSCFRVTDGKGSLIEDKRRKTEFLKQFENEFMVKEAIGNHAAFVEALAGTPRRTETFLVPLIADG